MVTVLTLGFLLVAAPAPPSGPKPRVEEVKVDDMGKPYLLARITEVVPVIRSVTVMVGGNGQVATVNVTEYKTVEKRVPLYLDADPAEVFSRDGKKLEPAEVRKLLAKPAKVLVSTDGKPIDPRHVERISEGIALVVSPSLVKTEKKPEGIAAPVEPTPDR